MRDGQLMRAVRSMPLLQYFFFAFLISWLFWLPLACSAAGILPFKLPGWLFFIGGVGPMAAAFIRAWQEGGVRRMGALLRRLFLWRLPVRLYLIAAFLPTSSLYSLPSLSTNLTVAAGGSRPASAALTAPSAPGLKLERDCKEANVRTRPSTT